MTQLDLHCAYHKDVIGVVLINNKVLCSGCLKKLWLKQQEDEQKKLDEVLSNNA